MIEGPRAIFLYVTNLDIGREWYSRALEVEPASIDEESVTFTVGGCLLTLKLTTAASHSLTSVYWGVDDLEWEYRRISEIGKMPTQSAQLAYVDSNAVELLDPFGNVFGLVGVGGKSKRNARHRRAAQKLALQNIGQNLDEIQMKEGEQRKIHRVIGWVVTVAVRLTLGFAWTFATMQTRPADTLPKLPIGATGR